MSHGDWWIDRQDLRAGFVAVIVVFSTLTGSNVVVAQEDLQMTLDAPQEATEGEKTTISASVTTPDLLLDPEGDLTVTLFVDGTQVTSETVTVTAGETVDVDLTHTFEQTGEVDIRVDAAVTLGGEDFSASQSTTIDVSEAAPEITGDLSSRITPPDSPQVGENTTTAVEMDVPGFTGATEGQLTVRLLIDGSETASKTITVQGNETTQTDFDTVFESSGETTITVEANLTVGTTSATASATATVNVSKVSTSGGATTVRGAAFTVPASLEDEVANFRESLSQDLDSQAFVLATDDDLYVVFTDQEPTKGVASVEGLFLERNLSTSNLTFGAIAATETSFNTTGTNATVPEVAGNASQYSLELVRISAHYRRVSTLYDPDQGQNITFSATAGIVQNASSADTLVSDPGQKLARLHNETARNRSRASPVAREFLTEPADPHLHTFSFETKFWIDHNATVDGIVLPPGSMARRFVSEFDRAKITAPGHNASLLYLVQDQYDSQSVQDVSEVHAETDTLTGEVITVEARLNGTTISVQETIEHNTECGETEADIDECVNIVLDDLVHAGVAWNQVPSSTDEALPVFGISSHHQDTPSTPLQGRYRLTGEIVEGSALNRSVTGPVLLVSDLERVGDIDRQEVNQEAQQVIAEKLRQLVDTLYSGIDRDPAFEILTTDVTGAAFPVPESLKDEVAQYRSSVNTNLSPHTFVLATDDSVYLVFTTQEPTKGLATTDGLVVQREIPARNLTIGNRSSPNLTVGVIGSVQTSFQTTGTELSIPELTQNTDEYRLDLVRIGAPYSRISTLTDPDAGAGFTFVETAGLLVNESLTQSRLFDRPGKRASNFVFNSSKSERGQNASRESRQLLGRPDVSHVATFSFEEEFWANANATVDAIALSPGSAARKYVRTIERVNITVSEAGQPLLYVVQDDFQPTRVQNVSTVAQQADELDGEVVEVEARLNQERISIQEVAEESTGCTEDLLEIQTPQGPICIDVVQDNLLHGGVAWNTVPTSREETLFVTGVSSRHQDEPISSEQGRYRIVGEVVSTSRVDASLPEASILLVYDLERVDNIDYEAVAAEGKAIIENRTQELVSRLRSQIAVIGPTSNTTTPDADAGSDTSAEPGTTVTLDGRDSSDPDGDTLTYGWTQTSGPPVSLSDADTATPSFTAPNVTSTTTLTFRLTVNDGAGGTDTDVVNVTVEPDSGGPFEGVTAQYNTDGDSAISIAELGDAASDYAQGELSIAELGDVAAAYARS